MTKRMPKLALHDVGGAQLRAAHWAPEKPSSKRPLLFCNGIGANLELVFRLGEYIKDRDLLAFDVPGVGGSPETRFPYRPWQLCRWVKKLTEIYGFEELDVMGVSWGGALAQQFTIQYRDTVKRVVLAATSTGMTMVPGRPEALAKMANPRRYVEPDYMRKNFETLYGDELDSSASAHTAALQPPTARGYMYQMTAMLGWTSVPFLPFVRQPILVMMGDKDRVVPLVNGRMIVSLAQNARLHVVEDGGHLFLVTRAEEVVPILTEFLDEDDAAVRKAS